MNRFWLKITAITTMLIDHIGAILFPEALWLRMIGRLAFPLFAWMIAQGYLYTRSRRNYLLRLLVFAVICEVPFRLAFPGHGSNVLWTLALGLTAICAWEALEDKILGGAAALACAIAALALKTDYDFYGVATVFLFHVFRERKDWGKLAGCLLALNLIYLPITNGFWEVLFSGGSQRQIIVHAANVLLQTLSMFSLLFVFSYNGRPGPLKAKYLFYAFYPAHILILYLIARFAGIGIGA
jgi:hypothetical protein